MICFFFAQQTFLLCIGQALFECFIQINSLNLYIKGIYEIYFISYPHFADGKAEQQRLSNLFKVTVNGRARLQTSNPAPECA